MIEDIKYISPFLSLDNKEKLYKRLYDVFKDYNITMKEAKRAVDAAFDEREKCNK